MVRLLPEPWVCQMMPPRRSCSPSWSAGLARPKAVDAPSERRGTAGSGDDLDASPADLGEQREVAHDVEQVWRARSIPATSISWPVSCVRLPSCVRDLVHRRRGGVLPLQVVLGPGGEGGHTGLVDVGGDHELVRPEQPLVALGHARGRAGWSSGGAGRWPRPSGR